MALGGVAIALAYGAAFLPRPAPDAAPWLMVAGITLLLLSTFWLGVRAGGQRPPALFRIALALLGLLLAGGFTAALALAPESPGSALLLGLPRRAAILLYGAGLVPALLLPVVYALTFDRTTLSEAGLADLRNRLARLRDQPPAGES